MPFSTFNFLVGLGGSNNLFNQFPGNAQTAGLGPHFPRTTDKEGWVPKASGKNKHLFYNKVALQIRGSKIVLGQMSIHMEKKKPDPYLTLYTKVNSRRSRVLTQKTKLQCFHQLLKNNFKTLEKSLKIGKEWQIWH